MPPCKLLNFMKPTVLFITLSECDTEDTTTLTERRYIGSTGRIHAERRGVQTVAHSRSRTAARPHTVRASRQ